MSTDADRVRSHVRLRCPYCDATSPPARHNDWQARNDLLSYWWHEHRNRHMPRPTIETCTADGQ